MWRKNASEIYRAGVIPFRPASLLRWLQSGKEQTLNLDPTSAVESPNTSDRSITIVVTEPFRRRRAIAERLAWYHLSRREIEVSLGVMRGLSNSHIAQNLFIDEKTVKDHLQRIYAKTNVHSRTKLISKVLGLDTELSYSNESECKQTV
jgi:DNA-binding NarL/FixJ family response regulator